MSIDIVRGELERLFSLDELLALTTESLGMDPNEVGGVASKASFARALAERCYDQHATAALIDAILLSSDDADPKLRELRDRSLVRAEELKAQTEFGPFKITRKIGESDRSIVYAAERDGAPITLKIFRSRATLDPRSVQRFLAHARHIAKVRHESLAANVEAGLIDGKLYLSYRPVDGQPLSARIARTGPLHINEARALLRGILSALTALHRRSLAHGDLRLQNIIIGHGEGGVLRPVIVDAGGDRLWGGAECTPWGSAALAKTASPERLRGRGGDPRSDLYSFGAMLFEILSGKPPFAAESAVDIAIAQLTQVAPLASTFAPKGWVSPELDELCAKLLSKSPSERPASAEAVLEVLDPQGASRPAGDSPQITDDELNDLVDMVVADPSDSQSAMDLESAMERGAKSSVVADAFVMAADQVELGDGEAKAANIETKKQLLFRAARVYEQSKDPGKTEEVYAALLQLDPDDEIVHIALEEARKALGKYEELIEMLLERSESSESHTERARALNQIGHLYCRELDDKEQGTFAFAQALAQHTENDEFASDLERAAGQDMKLWAEALQTLSQASTHPRIPAEAKVALFTRLGRWYSEKIARPDLGLPCYQAVLAVDPANEGALDGITEVYRRAQQWQELGQVLLSRADRAATPDQARNLRVEAADLLETRLGDQGRARDLYEQIFKEDPSNAKATEALGRIYQRIEDWDGYAKILERRAKALRGEERVEAMCRVAELFEDQLNDLAEATRRYEAALVEGPHNLTALKGLDRIYNRTGKYDLLLANLDKQIALSATPRQKINLYERIAGLQDEQFLDHTKAAAAWEAILAVESAHEGALTSLVRHYRALDRWEDVVALYDKHLKVTTDDKVRLDLLLASGRVLVDQVGSPERARVVYEKVLEIDPQHAGALESLASVRAATGDSDAALAAVESLAAKATTPENQADLWIRAAKILEDKGDRDGAIERYKAALDASPGHPVAASSLRAAYLARGDASSTVELIARQIEGASGALAKARLYGEMAQLLHDKVKDDVRAAEAATKAVDLDPTSLLGLLVTGDIAFDAGRYLEATKAYESLANRVDALPEGSGVGLLSRYVDALAKTGATDKALSAIEKLLELAPDDPNALALAGKAYFEAGEAKSSAKVLTDLVSRFSEEIDGEVRGAVMLCLGQARLASDDADGAIAPLMDAADLLPNSREPITALCKVYEAKKDWEEVVRIKTRRLDVADGEERSALLLEIGEVVATQIGDRTRAAKSYVAALDERPDDRRILTRLMQLYSEEKDWSKLIEVVVKLADKVDDTKQKAKYMHTAAIVCGRQIGDVDQAIKYYEQVLELDPTLDKAVTEAIDLHRTKGDHEGVERLLRVELDRASEAQDNARMLAAFDSLGELYETKLGWTGDAIDAYEAAQTLDPDDDKRNERLATLYASDPAQYLEKAVAAQQPILRRNPYKPEPYRLLRKLYTESKRGDAAWCLCQALYCMNFAEPDEERFYRRMRSETAAAATDALSDSDWASFLMHEDADPLLTAIFALLEPAVLKRNGQPLADLGYDEIYQLDLARHPYPMSQTLYYASGVLGMAPPVTFQNPNDGGGVSFLHAHTPAIVLGAAALGPDIPTQAAAFIGARHLTYYRPGLYLRHLVPTGTGLRAWLFAAIKLINPAFPVAKDLEGQVSENLKFIEPLIAGVARDKLASAVTKLLQSGAIDLKKWVAGVDLSADRAGFIVASDLELAQEMIRAADEASAAVAQKDRLKELVLFSASESYFSIRRKLGINIDG